jgi:hypothetical protein
MRLLAVVLAAVLASVGGFELPAGSSTASIFFTSLHTGDLVRLDNCGSPAGCDMPVTIATGLETYGGLQTWESSLLAASKAHHIVKVKSCYLQITLVLSPSCHPFITLSFAGEPLVS